MEIISKASEMLVRSNEIMLASIGEDGYPRVCVLSKIKSDGIRRFWVATGLSSTKVRHFRANPKGSACFSAQGNSAHRPGSCAGGP